MVKKELEDFLIEKKIIYCRCFRCKHIWLPRGKVPKKCPNCFSIYWKTPRKKPTKL